MTQGTCVPNAQIEWLMALLTKVQPREGTVISPNLKKTGKPLRQLGELDSTEGISLQQMRDMLGVMVQTTPEVKGADLLVCTYPYVYALLLDEAPGLPDSLGTGMWVGGPLAQHGESRSWIRYMI